MKDITIIGAGLVGKSLALALAPLGLKIALLENHLENSRANYAQDRPLSLSYASVEILKSLGLWSALADSAVPILEVHVSEQGRFGRLQFSAEEMQVSALGQVVSFAKLQDVLFTALSKNSCIELIEVGKLETISQDHEAVCVQYSQDSKIFSSILVGADGTQSDTREHLHISITEKAEDSLALIAQIEVEEAHHFRAYERFTDMGTIALLPLFSGRDFRVVWTLPKNKAEALSPDSKRDFLEKSFKHRIKIRDCVFQAQFPLKTILATEIIKGRAAILGNAAHTFHPIAAQGFNLSLWEVSILSKIISEYHAQKKSLSAETLKDFEKRILRHQKRIVDLTQNISSLFELPFLGPFRAAGLLATECLSPIKKRLARQLMGISI